MPVRALSLLFVLLVTRAMGWGGQHVLITWWSPVAYLWHDAAVALGFTACEYALHGRSRTLWAMYVIVTLYLVANIPVERALSTPLTPAMWRAAGGPLADSIRHYVTWWNVGLTIAGAASIAIAPLAARHVPGRPVLVAVAACTVLGPAAGARVDTRGMERNAWTALAGHLVRLEDVSAAPRDWRESDIEALPGEDLPGLRGAVAGRNVVLVSLESTGARYLGVYGATPDVAPNLSELSRSAVVFENAYAVYPESIKGLFSILCSMYPAFDTATGSYADVPCRPLAAVLRDRGYRTALFHSGRFDYLGMNAIVRNRGYELLADAGDIGGRHNSSFGVDEPSTVASILRWIGAGPRGQPFFVTYLPIAGHHPYEAPGGGPFPDEDEFGRYRNALRYGDDALGELHRGLEALGLERNTVWIVLGDHGEAFGQHEGNYGHTFQLYDENVRVPFLFAAPGLIRHTIRIRRVVSLLDTAPTVLDLVGVRVPDEYRGTSMLDNRSRTALFFTDYSLPLAGLRDGPRKIIVDLRSGRSRWFDMERDPGETTDLSGRYRAETGRYAKRLEGWIASQRESFAASAR